MTRSRVCRGFTLTQAEPRLGRLDRADDAPGNPQGAGHGVVERGPPRLARLVDEVDAVEVVRVEEERRHSAAGHLRGAAGRLLKRSGAAVDPNHQGLAV